MPVQARLSLKSEYIASCSCRTRLNDVNYYIISHSRFAGDRRVGCSHLHSAFVVVIVDVLVHGVPEFAGRSGTLVIPASNCKQFVILEGDTHSVNLGNDKIVPVQTLASFEEDLLDLGDIGVLARYGLILIDALCASICEINIIARISGTHKRVIFGSETDATPVPGDIGASLNADILGQAPHIAHRRSTCGYRANRI